MEYIELYTIYKFSEGKLRGSLYWLGKDELLLYIILATYFLIWVQKS